MRQLRYDFSNLMAERVGDHGIGAMELKALGPKIDAAAATVAQQPPGFCQLAGNTQLADTVARLAGEIKERCENFVVVGIGGSVLGNRALHTALNHPEYNHRPRPPRRGPRLFVADNVDPVRINGLLDVLDLDRTVFNVISKSGETAAIMSEFLVFRDALIRQLGVAQHAGHVLITTDPVAGALRAIANKDGYASLPVPPDVGGRWSVLSAVGLLSAAVTGIDIHKLLQGAAEMDALCGRSTKLWENPALTGAALHYLMDKAKGKNVHVFMPYAHGLSDVAGWFRQLGAESLGKRFSRTGKLVQCGPTPVVAVGVTDQHAVLQLFIDGPFDKVVTFVTVDEFAASRAIPAAYPEHEALNYLGGHTLTELITVEQRATEWALTQSGKPNCAIRLQRVDEESVGALLYLLEMQTAYAGELYGINAYDQPGVELGKANTEALLGRNGHAAKCQAIQTAGQPDPRWVVSA